MLPRVHELNIHIIVSFKGTVWKLHDFQYFFYPGLGSLVSLGVVGLTWRAVISSCSTGFSCHTWQYPAAPSQIQQYDKEPFCCAQSSVAWGSWRFALIKDAADPKHHSLSSSQVLLSNVLQPESDFSVTGENVLSPLCEGTVHRAALGAVTAVGLLPGFGSVACLQLIKGIHCFSRAVPTWI